MRFTLEVFERFLKEVELARYREETQHVKTVEQDLNKNMQALDTIYSIYWSKEGKKYETPPTFDQFYKIYFKKCKEAIMKFWDESGYGKRCNCFKNGLRARIYRTWTSIITQIHAAYLAEEIFGEGSVEQYTELDHQNIDFQIHTENGLIKVQVKKTTNRKEISRMNDRSENSPDIKYIRYYVPTDKQYSQPRYVRGENAGQLFDWAEQFVEFSENGFLNRYENGFITFTKEGLKKLLK
jgi:hypothetical protein